MGLKSWLVRAVSNPSQYAERFASRLPKMVEQLTGSIIGFSGHRKIEPNDIPTEAAIESYFEMQLLGYKAISTDLAIIMNPTSHQILNEAIYLRTYQTVASFLCMYADNTAQLVMKPANAEKFGHTLNVAAANTFAGRSGFDPEPRNTFAKIQEIIPSLLSGKLFNVESPGKGDALGRILDRIKLTPDDSTLYAFVVGSQKQPAGCGASYLGVITEIREILYRCVAELHW